MTASVKKGLTYRLTRDAVLLAMLLGILLNLAQVTLDYFSARKSMDGEVAALMDISFSPASQIAYNIDKRLARELLGGLLQHPAIIDARIVDPDGRVLAAKSRPAEGSPYRRLSDLLFGDSRIYQKNLKVRQLDDVALGYLRVRIDTYYYGTAFLHRATNTLISGAVKTLVLSIVLLFLFYFSLAKPMMRVIDALRQVEADAPRKTRLPTPRHHDDDEIGLLVHIINQHLDSIDANLDKVRLAESRMKDYSVELEQEVAQRTREISDKNTALQRGNRALVRAKEDAVHRARSRADFLASMSHEIRTPLNGVMGMLSVSLEGELETGQRNRLEIARNAGESLLNLLNDILDISKIEAGKLGLESIEFNLREIIEESTTLLSQHGRSKKLTLVTDIDPALPERFQGDPTRVRQIINNLLGNAIKFTQSGEVRIRAENRQDDTRIDVIDTGIGMTPEVLEHIFSPFSQGNADTTRRFGGSGLGLTLCRQLVERMHGHITVDSRLEKGTHVTVILPLPVHRPALDPDFHSVELLQYGVVLDMSRANPHRLPIEKQLNAWAIPFVSPDQSSITDTPPQAIYLCEADQLARGGLGERSIHLPLILLGEPREINRSIAGHKPRIIPLPFRRDQFADALREATGETLPPPPEEALAASARRSKPLEVLLVEDNRVNQIVASSMLQKLDYKVGLAENGELAIEALQRRSYDIVLMDCQMPVMDGYEATIEIRRNKDWANLPIIAVTANVMQGDKDQCIAAGMNDYITKPYRKQDLQAAIERWVVQEETPGNSPGSSEGGE